MEKKEVIAAINNATITKKAIADNENIYSLSVEIGGREYHYHTKTFQHHWECHFKDEGPRTIHKQKAGQMFHNAIELNQENFIWMVKQHLHGYINQFPPHIITHIDDQVTRGLVEYGPQHYSEILYGL